MKYRKVVEREGELLGPVDWTYDFRQHFNSMGSPDAVKDEYCARRVELLRRISEPGEWRVILAHSSVWKDVYAVGMYDGWPFWKPTPAMLTSGTLGAEWHFFYDLQGCAGTPLMRDSLSNAERKRMQGPRGGSDREAEEEARGGAVKLNVGEPDPANWPLVNCERGLLIDKNIAGTITAGEAAVLEVLQWYADWYLDRTKHPYDRAERRQP